MTDSRNIRVVVADGHADMLKIVSTFLKEYFQVLAIVTNGTDLVRAAITLRPDVIVSEVDMPAQEGLEAMSALRSLGVNIPFVLLGVHTESGLDFLQLGAAAYVHKFDLFADLLDAILSAAKGEHFISRSVGNRPS